jgi:hypothetical protein
LIAALSAARAGGMSLFRGEIANSWRLVAVVCTAKTCVIATIAPVATKRRCSGTVRRDGGGGAWTIRWRRLPRNGGAGRVGRTVYAQTRKEEVAVRKLVPAAFGIYLAAAGAAHGQEAAAPPPVEPGRLPIAAVSANQQLATIIAQRLRTNANLKNYRVDVVVDGGVAVLTGDVADSAQRDEVVRTAQAVPGVDRVRDGLTVTVSHDVVPAQATQPRLPPPSVGGGMPPEPLPIYSAPGGMPNPHLQPPPLPPNAWPTYAPYNNYSRVGYPTLYPYEAWPFIGPMYPFPKVPPGWRAVTLRWQDGYWWYGREASGHDWWRIRYW